MNREKPKAAVPWLAERLVTWATTKEGREDVLGDLEEAFRGLGADRSARAWYWKQAMLFFPHLLAERLREIMGCCRSWRERRAHRINKKAESAALNQKAKSGIQSIFSDLVFDLLYGFRILKKHPGFVAVALITLALGIGVNTALYTLFDARWNLPQRLEEPETLAYLWRQSPRYQRSIMRTSDYLGCREQSNSFAQMGAFTRNYRILAGHGEPERVRVLATTASIWPVLGFSAQIGRVHSESEDLPADSGVAMLSEKFWHRKFDGDPDVLGKSVLIDGKSHTIIGIMPREADLEDMWHRVDLFAPFVMSTADTSQRDRGHCMVLARLNPGVSFEQAQSELNGISARLAEAYPETNEDIQIWPQPLRQALVSFEDFMLMSIFLAAVAAVLLIACVNIANMQLAKASSRVREFAVKMAMGAKRGRLVRQLLTESLLLAIGGGVLGLLVGLWMLDLFVASVDFIPLLEYEIGLSPSVLIYTSVISLLAALVFGLAPVFITSRISPVDTLKAGTQSVAGGPSHSRQRNALVIGQLAIGLPLVICCGLAIRHVETLKSAKVLGINPDDLLTLRVELPTYHYTEEVQRTAFFQQMFERIAALPGIESVGAVSHLPIGSEQRLGGSITIEGRQEKEEHFNGYHVVTPGFFEAMGVQLLHGRVFAKRDNAAGPPVAILNQKAAMRYWPEGDAVGRQILLDGEDYPANRVTIVGVVADFGCTVFGEPFPPALYVPHGQNPMPGMELVVRAQGDPESVTASVRETIRGMDAGIPVYSIRTVNDLVHTWLRDDRWLSYFLGGLAVLVLCLACIGLFGIMSYAVVQRTNELGIRIAMGADRAEILRLVIKGCLKLSGTGILIGLLLSMPIGLFMASYLYGVGGLDPLTYGGVILLLLAVALAAGYLPARRAARIDPLLALRYE
jgi:putative ABC transport system permease protein